MSIKLIVLNTGERVVANIHEMRNKERVTIGYVMVHPQILSMTKAVASTQKFQTNEPEFKVTFTPWNPFSKHQQFRLNIFSIVSLNDVREDIEKIYTDEFHDEDWEFIPEELSIQYTDFELS
tara:strand:- start:260 stop:625 length:366 start_codon:yes stop_codon:yes gene_type:complete